MPERDPSQERGRILVGVDGSEANRPAVEWAASEARARGCGLLAVEAWHVPAMAYSAPGYIPISTDWIAQEAARTVDEAVTGIAGPDHHIEVETQIVEGSAYDSLSLLAASPGVDLVVLGSRGHGAVTSLLLGSVSHSMSHHCPKPLVIVPQTGLAGHGTTVGHIVVGVDGSEAGERALRWAASEAGTHQARLEVVVAWSWTTHAEIYLAGSTWGDAQKAAHEVITDAVDRLVPHGVDVKLTEVESIASDALLEAARSADLLVVGTRRLNRAKEVLLGSTSHQCSHHSPVPIAIIPPELAV